MRIEWDEYTVADGAGSDRGWAGLVEGHPDGERGAERRTVGWYLDYAGTASQGPAGEPILASAYVFRVPLLLPLQEVRLGCSWFWTVADAKAWIERAVADHLERLAVRC